MTTSYSREYSWSTLRSFQSTSPTVGASLNTGTQMYSKVEPLVDELDRTRKLFVTDHRSHAFLPSGRLRDPIRAWLRLLAVMQVALACGGPRPAARVPMTIGPAGSSVDLAALSRDLNALAADSMRGREAGT